MPPTDTLPRLPIVRSVMVSNTSTKPPTLRRGMRRELLSMGAFAASLRLPATCCRSATVACQASLAGRTSSTTCSQPAASPRASTSRSCPSILKLRRFNSSAWPVRELVHAKRQRTTLCVLESCWSIQQPSPRGGVCRSPPEAGCKSGVCGAVEAGSPCVAAATSASRTLSGMTNRRGRGTNLRCGRMPSLASRELSVSSKVGKWAIATLSNCLYPCRRT